MLPFLVLAIFFGCKFDGAIRLHGFTESNYAYPKDEVVKRLPKGIEVINE